MSFIQRMRLPNVGVPLTIAAAMLKNRTTVRIGWGDCDPAGIVFFPRYLAFCNEATGALFESIGFPKPLLLKTYDIVGYPVVQLSASFSKPCTFGEDIVIETWVAEWGRTSFKLQHRLLRNDEVAVECEEKRVWAARDPESPAGIRGKPIPDEIKVRLGR